MTEGTSGELIEENEEKLTRRINFSFSRLCYYSSLSINNSNLNLNLNHFESLMQNRFILLFILFIYYFFYFIY